MPVERLKLMEFGAFRNVDVEFVKGLNVFIGANGTGKTHLMKVMYALLEAARKSGAGSSFQRDLASKLAGVFHPDDGEIGRLVRRKQGQNTAKCMMATSPHSPSIAGRPTMAFRLHTKGPSLTSSVHPSAVPSPSVYLPTREVLAMYEGFIHAYRERELSFDETYFDACVALNANPLRGPKQRTAERLAKRLRVALGGHVELRGSRFYVKFAGDRARMEAHLVAEGLRKIASLERLVLNGKLTKNAHLFWDEPEANLNPKLIVVVADLLAELAKAGVQLFITTHDYLLAKRLSISARSEGFPSTRFFAFYRPRPEEPVTVDFGADLSDLPSTPMVDEFLRLYDFEVQSQK